MVIDGLFLMNKNAGNDHPRMEKVHQWVVFNDMGSCLREGLVGDDRG
jgi:hypothetical protein